MRFLMSVYEKSYGTDALYHLKIYYFLSSDIVLLNTNVAIDIPMLGIL